MSIIDPIEVTAATVEEAIRQALAQLGAREEDVTIEVLATPRAGVLGLGVRQAKIRVTHRPPPGAASGVQSPPPRAAQPPARPERRENRGENRKEDRRDDRREDRRGGRPQPPRSQSAPPSSPRPQARDDRESGADSDENPNAPRRSADLEQQAAEAAEALAQILALMGEKAEVTRVVETDPDSLELEIKGDGSGILIGRHGQTLDALEYVINRIVARRIRDAVPIMLETEAYRARRRQQLHRMALAMGERAKREHQSVMLEPMAPRDRRVIHLALKEDPMLTTRSSGDGFLRAIEIVPVGAPRSDRGGPAPGPGRGRRRDNRENREKPRERERPNDALGEQGGFKHGQKRIV
jgi:spoIIIJ-associated protein